MRLGVVADSHGLADPALARVLAGVDEILHAGDVVRADVLEPLRALAPLVAVRGNNDLEPALSRLPEERLLLRAGVRILLRHIAGKPQRPDRDALRSIARHRPDVLVCGHSHQVLATRHEGVLWLNPGSCGPRRFRLARTAAVLELDGAAMRFVVTDLDTGRVAVDEAWPR